MKKLVLVCLLTLLSLPVFACDREVTITRVVDGDTFAGVLHLGFGVDLNKRIRVLGFDAPETWRPRNKQEAEHGRLATEYATKLIENADIITFSGERFDSFGRVLLNICIDGEDFVQKMVEAGFEKRSHY